MRNTLLLVLCLVVSASVSAQQYKWVDKDGKVRYGDTPPAGVKATPLRGSSAPAAPAPRSEAKDAKDGKAAKAPARLTPAEQEAEFRKRRQQAEKDQQKSALAAQEARDRRANCEAARDALRQLQSGERITKTNAQGERYFLDDAQREAEMDRARRLQKDSCPD